MLSDNRETRERAGDLMVIDVAANVTLFQGAIVCTNAAGDAVPGSTATTLTAQGISQGNYVGGPVAGTVRANVKRGCFLLKNHGADPVTKAERNKPCFIVDDETVAKTDGAGTRSKAGIVHEVSDGGVWVRF